MKPSLWNCFVSYSYAIKYVIELTLSFNFYARKPFLNDMMFGLPEILYTLSILLIEVKENVVQKL